MIPQITTLGAYDVCVNFAEEQKSGPGNVLLKALNQRKPFRNLRKQLAHMQLEDAWYIFEYQYTKSHMAEWLEEWNTD